MDWAACFLIDQAIDAQLDLRDWLTIGIKSRADLLQHCIELSRVQQELIIAIIIVIGEVKAFIALFI